MIDKTSIKREIFCGNTVVKLAFTRHETALALGISDATVDRLTKRGLLRPSRATRRPLYSMTDLQRFLSQTTSTIPTI